MTMTGGSAASRSLQAFGGRGPRPPSRKPVNVGTNPTNPLSTARRRLPVGLLHRPSTPGRSTVNSAPRIDSTLTFRAPPAPWYRTKQATIALIASACRRCGRADCHARAGPMVPRPAPSSRRPWLRRHQRAAQPAPSSQRIPTNAPPITAAASAPAASDRGLTGSADTQPWTRPAAPADAEAGRRGDAHACDPGADQCGAAATTTNRKQLRHPRGRPQGLALGPDGDLHRSIRS